VQSDLYQLVAICDVDADNVKQLSCTYDVPGFNTLEDMLTNIHLDSILLALPHTHPLEYIHEILNTLLGAGKKQEHILADIATKFSVQATALREYLQSQEQLTGFAIGGSGSLVLFVAPSHVVVRKIWSEKLAAAKWHPDGTGVMSPPLEKAKLQVDYIRNLPEPVKQYFPRIYDWREIKTHEVDANGVLMERREILCDQSYIPGIEVSTFIERYQPEPKVVAHLHREILRCLKEKIHPHRKKRRDCPTVELSYLSKIVQRLEIAQQTAPNTFTPLISSDYVWINGKRYKNIAQLLHAFRGPNVQDILEPAYHCLVMGDSNTENIKLANRDVILTAMQEDRVSFTYEEIGIQFLDPRAIGFASAGANVVDDYMYDNKLLHNSLGNYDVIHAEHFRIHMAIVRGEPHITIVQNEQHSFREPYRDIEQYFLYIMEGWGVSDTAFLHDDPYWLVRFAFIMGTHFAAMPPFHLTKERDGEVRDEYEPQKRAIAVYCEGIKWLNIALAMLTGEQKKLYGVSVPSLPTSVKGGC
jgi:hypothetical protein